MPAVSVVIPAHNRADLLGQTLDSVLSQTLTDWECIVVDDGSTDSTAAIAESYADRDPRFRVIRGSFGSASAARNRGAAEAQGPFISFLDSDDLMEPDKLEWQVAALQADSLAAIVYGEAFIFHGADPRQGSLYLREVKSKPRSFESLLSCSAIYAPTVRTETFREAGGFDESLASAEDWDMWLTLTARGKLLFEPRIALRYRAHPGNKSADTLRNLRCAVRVARKHLRRIPAHCRPLVAARLYRYFARVYPLPLLAQARESGDGRRQARAAMAAAALLRPRWLVRYPSAIPGLVSLLRKAEDPSA